jgi:hypothetical protein
MFCAMEPCGLAREFIPDHLTKEPCRALEHDACCFGCGMIRRPGHNMRLPSWVDAHMGSIFAGALGAGKGCDADDPE